MATSANDKIQLGFIGVAGRGSDLLQWFSKHGDVQVTAICDLYPAHRQRAIDFVGGTAKGYENFRDLLADDSVEAVIIATPPQWHAIMATEALQAGKDVYCEKPMSRFPGEGKLMADFAAKYNRVTQVGTQVHATENYRKCVDIVRSGALGKITAVRNFCAMNDDSEGLGNPEDTAPLEGLDWNMWLGPAPETPFNIGRFRDGMHRYFADYVDSWLHELGPHIVDLPFWALDLPCPKRVVASGGRYATHSIADVPDTMDVIWEWDDMVMTWTLMQSSSFHFGVGSPGPGRKLGIVFHGEEGTLLANYGLCQVLDKKGNLVEGAEYPAVNLPSPGHEREFLNAIRSREECSCSFRRHLSMHTALNLAHIAMKTNRKLQWSEETWEVVGDEEANRLCTPTYRAPWKLPTL